MDDFEASPPAYTAGRPSRRELGDGGIEVAMVYVMNTRMRSAKVIAGGDWRKSRKKFGENIEYSIHQLD